MYKLRGPLFSPREKRDATLEDLSPRYVSCFQSGLAEKCTFARPHQIETKRAREREREREREIVHYAAMATRRLHKERSKALKRMSFDGSGEACNKLRRPYEIASIDQH